jgi:DNA adenine methylase
VKYVGSKNRIAHVLLKIILRYRKKGQVWFEPFVGGGNMIQYVENPRIGIDINKYAIAALQAIQRGEQLPQITKKKYLEIKKNKENFDPWLVGWVGFSLSYASRFFIGWAEDSDNNDYIAQANKNAKKQKPLIKDVVFKHADYKNYTVPAGALIYADPPYKNTSRYRLTQDFDHGFFWDWCREKTKKHIVFISEKTAPEDFISVLSIENSILLKIGQQKKYTEKLFVHESQLKKLGLKPAPPKGEQLCLL